MRKLAIVSIAALLAIALLSLAGCKEAGSGGGGGGGGGYDGPTGEVEGTVIDATTGGGLEGVTVRIVGYNEFDTTTDADGAFVITSPTGEQTIRFILTGYVFSDLILDVLEGISNAVSPGDTVGSPDTGAGQARIVLTWGELPYDIDSHLLTPNGQHVYFGDPTPAGAGAYLDVDDVVSYGPETITITAAQAGTYVYYVYNFDGSPDLNTSNATVKIYDSGGLLATRTVPTADNGRYWYVMDFEFDGSDFSTTYVDTMQDSAPTN